MGSVAEALSLLLAATNAAATAIANAQQISAMIQQANAAGTTTFTPEQWTTIQKIDDDARAALVASITAALAK
jgi:hypothetical protein